MFTSKYLYLLTFLHMSLLSIGPVTNTEFPMTRTATVKELKTTFLLVRQKKIKADNLFIEELPTGHYQLWSIGLTGIARKVRLDDSTAVTPDGKCVNQDFLKDEYNRSASLGDLIDVPVTPR